MQLDRDVMLMAQIPLFEGLSEEQLEILAFSTDRQVFCKGDRLTTQGQAGEAAFLLTDGAVKRFGIEALGIPDQYLFDGSLIGELAMMVEIVHDRSHIALEDCTVMAFTREGLHRIMRRYPEIGLHLSSKLAQRLAEIARLMRAVERENQRRRVIAKAYRFRRPRLRLFGEQRFQFWRTEKPFLERFQRSNSAMTGT